MSTARDFLAAVQQRADRKVLWPAMSPEKANDLVAALKDRRRLAAALTAALDQTQFPVAVTDDFSDGYNHALRDVLTAITDALTPKENDS